MNLKFTEEIKQAMCDDYLVNKLKLDEIYKKYNISQPHFLKIRKERNIQKRVKSNALEVNEDYFNSIDSYNKSYWLGFIAADGCILRDRQYLSLRIVLGTQDCKHLEKFKVDIGANQEIKFVETHDNRTDKIYKSNRIQIARRKICEDLIKHGVGPDKSKELHVPKTIPEEFIPDFIRGYSDGDGSFNLIKRKNINRIRYNLISSTKSLLEEIQQIFDQKLKINPTTIIVYPNNTAYKIYYQNDKDVKKIYDYLYQSNGPRLDRKYELATNHFNSEDHKINILTGRK